MLNRKTHRKAPEATGRRPWSRLLLLTLFGGALIAGAVSLRSSGWARERQLKQLSAESLSLMALERPNDPLVFQYLAQRLYEENDLAGALGAFERAAHLSPRSADAQLGFGLALMQSGRPYEAETYLVKAAKIRPKDVRPHLLLADLYERHRNTNATIGPLEKVTQLDPKHAQAWYRLGLAWGDLHQFDNSLEALKRAVRLNGRRADYLRDLGQVHMHFGQVEEARTALTRSRAIEPRDPGTLVLLARLELSQGGTDEQLEVAEGLLKEAQEVDPEFAPIYRELGALYIRREKRADAIRALRESVRLDPTDGQALFQLGQALLRAGQRKEGQYYLDGFKQLTEARRTVLDLEDRIHQEPKNPELRLRIARVFRKYGREDRAINQYQVYLTLKPNDPEVVRELKSYTEQLRKRGRPSISEGPK